MSKAQLLIRKIQKKGQENILEQQASGQDL